jgi:hypothetical protein
VIWHKDATQNFSLESPTYERRLTPAGLELVRSGVLEAWDFIEGNGRRVLPTRCATPPCPVPSEVWTDAPNSMRTPWTPSEYTGCLYQEVGNQDRYYPGAIGPFRAATNRVGDLPAAVQSLLRGPRRVFAGAGRVPPDPADHFFPAGECFVLTPQAAHAALDLNGPHRSPWVESIAASPAEGAIGLMVLPVLPHGAALGWGDGTV